MFGTGVVLGACGGEPRPPASATAPVTAPITAPATSAAVPATSALPVSCAAPAAGTAAPASALVPAPSNGLAPSPATGEPLVIEAVILDRRCAPAAGAMTHLWHADARGLYGPSDGQQCCYYDGNVRADGAGRFRLETIRPAQYPVPNAPPAHIHLEISYQGRTLETEVIFGDQAPASIAPPTSHVLSIPLRRDGDGWRGEALFVLAG